MCNVHHAITQTHTNTHAGARTHMHAHIYIFIEAESITRFLILEKRGCQSDIVEIIVRAIEIKLIDVKENLHKVVELRY